MTLPKQASQRITSTVTIHWSTGEVNKPKNTPVGHSMR